MTSLSVGLLMYRQHHGRTEILLVHPGGPFWKRRDIGAWSVPKGLVERDEDPFAAAVREFSEETGIKPSGRFIPLTRIRVHGRKWLQVWAFEGDCDPAEVRSNTFTMEWPPDSGMEQAFPEVDRAAWFDLEEAKKKIHKGQQELVDELKRIIPRRAECEPLT